MTAKRIVSLAALCDHIEQTHHAYLRTELSRLQALVTRTVQAHGASHPELLEVRSAFTGLVAELMQHMLNLERDMHQHVHKEDTFSSPAPAKSNVHRGRRAQSRPATSECR